jgi:hypothetical protein
VLNELLVCCVNAIAPQSTGSETVSLGRLAAQAMGGFFGAFFAFIFVGVQRWMERRRERWKRNHNNLVEMQHQEDRLLSALHENQFAIENIKSFVAEHLDDPVLPLPLNRCKPVTFNEKLHDGLRNVDLVNELLRYQENLRSLNSTVVTINESFDLVRSALINQTITPSGFRVNLAGYVHGLVEVEPFVADLVKDTKVLIGRARILIRLDRRSRHGIFGQKNQRYGPDIQALTEVELAKLDEEMEQMKVKNQARIDRILGKDKRGE